MELLDHCAVQVNAVSGISRCCILVYNISSWENVLWNKMQSYIVVEALIIKLCDNLSEFPQLLNGDTSGNFYFWWF